MARARSRRSARELRDDKLARRQQRRRDGAVAHGAKAKAPAWTAPYGRPHGAVPEDFDG
jgi:hypothetical protein